MPASADHVAVLRAFLADDRLECTRLIERLEQSNAGFGVLAATAFAVAVHRRFGQGSSAAEIGRFVASVRNRYGENADDIDPSAADHLIRVALGDAPAGGLDDTEKAVQIPLLAELVSDEELDSCGLDVFLAEVCRQAGP